MVAVIHSSKSLRNVLNYHEQKVKAGLAICLEAGYYPMDAADLTFHQKLRRLEMLTELNQRTKVNSVHISLNFDPSEKLSEEVLKEIAGVYLDKIGFAAQPYLLYQHHDAGHPHIHLLTTNIKPDGKRIPLHKLGEIQSSQARREIEIDYGLVKAEESHEREAYRLKPVDARKVEYGRVESKRAMGNVIAVVLQKYRYGSLPELNAILQLYNITADRGSENSRVFQHQGLVYRILDTTGNKVGVPVKASDFYFKPTLKYVTGKMLTNQQERDQHKPRIKNAIDLFFLHPRRSLTAFVQALQKDGIDVVIRKNNDGLIYGITYIDHEKYCVFNGSALGKSYSAKAILEKCAVASGGETGQAEKRVYESLRSADTPDGSTIGKPGPPQPTWAEILPDSGGLADVLLQQEYQSEHMDWQLKRKRKKRKRQQIGPQ